MGLADEVVASLSLVLATKVWTCEVGSVEPRCAQWNVMLGTAPL